MFFLKNGTATGTKQSSLEREHLVAPPKTDQNFFLNALDSQLFRVGFITAVRGGITARNTTARFARHGMDIGAELAKGTVTATSGVNNRVGQISRDPVVREGVSTLAHDAFNAIIPRLPAHLRPIAEHAPKYFGALVRVGRIVVNGDMQVPKVDKGISLWHQIDEELRGGTDFYKEPTDAEMRKTFENIKNGQQPKA